MNNKSQTGEVLSPGGGAESAESRVNPEFIPPKSRWFDRSDRWMLQWMLPVAGVLIAIGGILDRLNQWRKNEFFLPAGVFGFYVDVPVFDVGNVDYQAVSADVTCMVRGSQCNCLVLLERS